MEQTILKIDNVSKRYRLGQIGRTTFREEMQRFSAKIRHKEDPTKKIGAADYQKGETFMALDGVSFSVKKGERVGIIGHNGAGKSTLLKLISRITAPTGGSIFMNGRVASMLEVGTGFHGELTGRENIYMNGAILGMTKKEIGEKIEDIIEFSECREFIDTPVKRYSSGMYVKLAFSVAAHLNSEIMIMDEVLAVGDAQFQNKCLDKMSSVSMEEGRTILYVSHNMNTIRKLCDRVVVLNHGKLVYDGAVEEGIRIYMNNSELDEMKAVWNLRDVKRLFRYHGVDARLSELRFLEKQGCIYERNEKIKLQVTWSTKKKIEAPRFFIEIKSEDASNVGAVESEVIEEYKIGEDNTTVLELDISSLAEGRYYFNIVFYTVTEAGGHWSYDHPLQKILFEVVNYEPYSITWQEQYWGHGRLPRMKVLK